LIPTHHSHFFIQRIRIAIRLRIILPDKFFI
jgi:hypothetical protein